MGKEYFKVMVSELPKHIKTSGVDDCICFVISHLEKEHDAEFVQYIERLTNLPFGVNSLSYFIMRREVKEPVGHLE